MSQSSFSIVYSKGPGSNNIEVMGSLVINYIDKIHQELSNHVDLSKGLNIVVKKVENIDITFVQLLLSLQKEFNGLNLPIAISMELGDDSWSLLQNAGFKNQFIN